MCFIIIAFLAFQEKDISTRRIGRDPEYAEATNPMGHITEPSLVILAVTGDGVRSRFKGEVRDEAHAETLCKIFESMEKRGQLDLEKEWDHIGYVYGSAAYVENYYEAEGMLDA